MQYFVKPKSITLARGAGYNDKFGAMPKKAEPINIEVPEEMQKELQELIDKYVGMDVIRDKWNELVDRGHKK